ncbi:MHYT domain-containing protein [Brevundimonas sp.]|uniref:MHYT domain-containing protein n=1 Tax=Brevundimonas sp. TaxID=1871086 RepID=UPI002ABC2423|nr:MHYT domain-containing protein [Brevundimonas sp.]MDZ4363760.1 MHYT domain-containing protein [Brevundimonas sp.]
MTAAWTALDLLQRVRTRTGTEQTPWLATAALAMGGGVWAMHFIAMLGFDPGAPVRYDVGLTLLSFLLAVAGTAGAFFAATRARLGRGQVPAAGIAMGLAIALMHYVGMAAMRTTATVGWRPELVLVSVLIAIGASMAALWAAGRDVSIPRRALAAGVLGLAVVGMHYTGMAALRLQPTAMAMGEAGAPSLAIAIGVASMTIVILLTTLAASIADQRTRLLDVIEAGGVGYWEIGLRDREVSLSARAQALLDLPPGQTSYAFDSPPWLRQEDAETRQDALRRALAGEAPYDVEFPIGDGSRWVQAHGSLIRSRSGRPIKLAGVVRDITDRRRAFADLETSERRQKLLINELNHRVKNTLATIQSIAALTARRVDDVEDFITLFQARLMALSDTHNLLTASGWEKATLRDLLSKELRPYSSEQIRLEGPEIWLEAPQALAMGMIAHELATNAAKYGALSLAGGCVRIVWADVDADGRVTMDWNESDGPPVTPPSRTGFGSRLIATSLKGDLGGTVDIDYRPEGFQARLTFRTSPRPGPGSLPQTA